MREQTDWLSTRRPGATTVLPGARKVLRGATVSPSTPRAMTHAPSQARSAAVAEQELVRGGERRTTPTEVERGVGAARPMAEEALHAAADGEFTRANRHFRHLAVEHLARVQGVDQFLDLGTGLPAEPHLHQIAQYHRPDARVLYVDNDPAVLTYAEALLISSPRGRVDYVHTDVRRPEELWAHPCLAGPDPVLDRTRPVALFAVALLDSLSDADAARELLRRLLQPLARGSFLVLSHATEDFVVEADADGDSNEDSAPDDAADVTLKGVGEIPSGQRAEVAVRGFPEGESPVRYRSREEIEELVAESGAVPMEPGVRPVNRWWPARAARLAPLSPYTDAEVSCYGVLARKP